MNGQQVFDLLGSEDDSEDHVATYNDSVLSYNSDNVDVRALSMNTPT